MKVELLAAIVNWHLPSFPMAEDVAVALQHASGVQTTCIRRSDNMHVGVRQCACKDTAAVTCDFANLMRHLLNGVAPPHHHSMLPILCKHLCIHQQAIAATVAEHHND